MTKAKYSCAQKDLYPAVRLGVKKLSAIQTKLVEHKAKYTLSFFQDLDNSIDAAEALPDNEARVAKVKTLILDTEAQEKIILKYSVIVESYIRGAFEKDRHNIMIDAAGGNYWKKAQRGDANSVRGLSTAMTAFVNEYKDTLMANNNMPPRIITEIVLADADYRQIISNLSDAKALVPDSRDTKIEANNNLYAILMDGLLDAQSQDATNTEWVRDYTFAALLSQVRGIPNAGFNGKITEADGKTPVIKALIQLNDTTLSVESDEEGRYEVTPLSESKVSVTVSAVGFVTQVFHKINIKTGVMTRLNVKLVRE